MSITKKLARTAVLLSLTIITLTGKGQPLAFPGAEGYGKNTTGGRGGAVIEVTNLNSSGAGSFAAAVAASGARTVVFRVGGTIDADITISNDNITIAGQTAPGDGITLKGKLSIKASNVIIRYIRVRAEGSDDALEGRYEKNIIIDHVSTSWSGDEVMSIYHGEYVTIQWSMITEACSNSHKFGGIWGNQYGTYHHNLLAHNASRNPRWASGCGYNDYRNNLLYNWGYNSCYGGEAHQENDKRTPPIEHSTINMIANYYKPGPGTESGVRSRIADPSSRDGDADAGKWWVSDNFVEGSPSVTADNLKGVTKTSSAYRLNEPWPAMAIDQQTAEKAYYSVLDNTGCSLPNRDTIDKRIIEEVRNGTTTYGSNGFISSPSVAGGWPSLQSGTAPADSDHDGMPDDWEDAHSLDKNSAADRNTVAPDGYTMLEKYLNSIEFNYSVTGIKYRFTEQDSIKITWKDTYIAEDAFIIKKSTDGGLTFEPYDTVAMSIVEYMDASPNSDNMPYYCIVAMQDSFQSPCVLYYTKVTDFEVQASDQILVGDTTTFTVTFMPENATNQLLEWSLRPEDSDLASISPTGEFIAKDTGTVELTIASLDSSEISKTISIHIVEVIVGNENILANTAKILKVFPNPFKDEVNFELSIPARTKVDIKIVDISGVVIGTISNRVYDPGLHTINWKVAEGGKGMLQSGVYFCKITIGNNVQVQKLILLK